MDVAVSRAAPASTGLLFSGWDEALHKKCNNYMLEDVKSKTKIKLHGRFKNYCDVKLRIKNRLTFPGGRVRSGRLPVRLPHVVFFLKLSLVTFPRLQNARWMILYLEALAGKHPLVLHVTTALHLSVQHCTALHCTALHCTALHCTVL